MKGPLTITAGFQAVQTREQPVTEGSEAVPAITTPSAAEDSTIHSGRHVRLYQHLQIQEAIQYHQEEALKAGQAHHQDHHLVRVQPIPAVQDQAAVAHHIAAADLLAAVAHSQPGGAALAGRRAGDWRARAEFPRGGG